MFYYQCCQLVCLDIGLLGFRKMELWRFNTCCHAFNSGKNHIVRLNVWNQSQSHFYCFTNKYHFIYTKWRKPQKYIDLSNCFCGLIHQSKILLYLFLFVDLICTIQTAWHPLETTYDHYDSVIMRNTFLKFPSNYADNKDRDGSFLNLFGPILRYGVNFPTRSVEKRKHQHSFDMWRKLYAYAYSMV